MCHLCGDDDFDLSRDDFIPAEDAVEVDSPEFYEELDARNAQLVEDWPFDDEDVGIMLSPSLFDYYEEIILLRDEERQEELEQRQLERDLWLLQHNRAHGGYLSKSSAKRHVSWRNHGRKPMRALKWARQAEARNRRALRKQARLASTNSALAS